MKIVILGGSGYLASCLCFYLRKKNKITLVSRSKRKIKIKHKNVDIEKVNYYSFKSLIKIFKKKDYIFHLVGANSFFSKKNKIKSFNFKNRITKLILEAANKTNAKIIYFSTSQVYKNIYQRDVNEDSEILKKNSYVKNHLMAENLILKDIKINKTKHKIIRLSSAFGFPFWNESKETFNLIINSLCRQAIEEKKMIIKDPSTLRDFFPVRIFDKVNKYLFEEKKNKIYNFGYKTFLLIDIAKIVQKKCFKFFKFYPKIVVRPFKKKKKLPKYKSKYFLIKKKNIEIENEISNLLKLIHNNAK